MSQVKQVFISYDREDTDFAHRLTKDLKELGMEVWIAPESILPGEDWVDAINRGLSESSHMATVLTPSALKSKWVKKEISTAIIMERYEQLSVIPLDVEPCSPPPLLLSYQMISFREDYEEGLRQLASTLKPGKTLPTPTPPPLTPPQHMPSVTALPADYKLCTTGPITGLRDIVFHDKAEKHGRWVKTREKRTLVLPEQFRMGRYLVTNEFFLEFVKKDGYATESYWGDTPNQLYARVREGCLSQDGCTMGPSTWPSKNGCLDGREHHPVAGISYYEALAFCDWLQKKHPPSESKWRWCLPTEDMWELSARTRKGLSYPWGSEFSKGCCNSAEAGVGTTTDVNRYSKGTSEGGCFDMAGNVWEYVVADDQEDWSCVLKGGSSRNNKDEVKSYLRLFGVPREHRPPDFGFRCAQKFQGGTA
jgi:formylglycine-generating enzyme required for sulfatase activity